MKKVAHSERLASPAGDPPVEGAVRLGCGGALGAVAAWSYLVYWDQASGVVAAGIVAGFAVFALLAGDFFWRHALRILRMISWF